jgi:hypothetical protein
MNLSKSLDRLHHDNDTPMDKDIQTIPEVDPLAIVDDGKDDLPLTLQARFAYLMG